MWGNTSIFGMAAMIRSRRDGGEADTLWPRRNEMKTALLVSIACLIVSVQPCAAEWFADVYAGVSLTDKDDIKVVSTEDRKSTRLNSSHSQISYAVFCLKKKKMHKCR